MGSNMRRICETTVAVPQEAEPTAPQRARFAAPLSPHDLIQEHYRDDPEFEWKVLVCCMMLNQTSRKQLDQVVERFFEKWSNPFDLLIAVPEDIEQAIKSLGFKSMRTKRLLKMSDQFMEAKKVAALEQGEGARLTSEQASALYGVGEYALRAFEIFCLGKLGDEPPQDHSLIKYWSWGREHFDEYNSGWEK